MNKEITDITKNAKEASRKLMWEATTELKNRALIAMADALAAGSKEIFAANEKDLKAARAKKLSAALVDRLVINDKRLKSMSDSLRSIARLDDPVGRVISTEKRPNGLVINKVRVPIGVICIVYESRPNVTSDCVGLCLKSGNAVIL
ncbi:MAG: gamma-glutamyl-phosphate reductase, partial [Candidatus Omnitrophota bacterium]